MKTYIENLVYRFNHAKKIISTIKDEIPLVRQWKRQEESN